MDGRQYQESSSGGPPPQQPQPQMQSQHGNRFSWQLPADNAASSTSQPPQHPTMRPVVTEFGQPERQQSWTETPADMRPAQNWPRTAQHVPTEPSIPQSPVAGEAPVAPPWDGQAQQPQQQQQQNISAQEPQATPHQYVAQPQLVVPYAVLPQAANSQAMTRDGPPSPPLSIQTNTPGANLQTVFSPGALAPEPTSTLDPEQVQTPVTVADASPKMTYTPHATTSRHTFRSSADVKSGLPFAPDDLLHTHNAAAIEEGRASNLPLAATGPANTQAHQPGQIRHPNMKTAEEEGRKGEWRHSLMGCGSDVDSCCLGFTCPCILHSRTSYRLSARGEKRDPTDLLGFEKCNGTCSVMAASLCLGFLFPAISRTRIRHHYKIEGGAGGDFCTSCLCCCCVVVQNEREVKEREESRRRWAGPATGAGVQYAPPPTEMRYAPGGGS